MHIITYHFVRDMNKSRYKGIKALDIKKFERQIKILSQKYNFVDPYLIKEKIVNHEKLLQNDCWLTFDDGYLDHYKYVFPLLNKLKIKGSFFPVVNSTKGKSVLNINKIHFILSQNPNASRLLSDIENYLSDNNLIKKYGNWSEFINKIDTKHRYDKKDVVIVKRLLQRDLFRDHRQSIVDILFNKYVSSDQKSFAKETYMSELHLLELYDSGHEIGSHGINHDWFTYLNKDQQRSELNISKDFLNSIGILNKHTTMCYPYGAYNKDTLDLMNECGYSIGLRLDYNIVPRIDYKQFEISRADTNDYPS